MSAPPWTEQPPETPLRLMSLWGGFAETAKDETGPEKRLEMDFRPFDHASKAEVFTPQKWTSVLEHIECYGGKVSENDGGLSIVCEQAVLVLNPQKLVIITCASVELHRAISFILDMCKEFALQVQWASFMRKNTTSPWAHASGQGMALEYSLLKTAFPSGRPFLVGPLDSDHYFYFVYDDIHRETGVLEDDVQVNVLMYEVKCNDADYRRLAEDILCAGDAKRLNFHSGKDGFVACATHAMDYFETLRFSSGKLGGVLSFETNVNSEEAYRVSISKLVDTSAPERFSVVLLLDPKCAPIEEPNHAPMRYQGYSLLNVATTEFEHGYVVRKMNFIKE